MSTDSAFVAERTRSATSRLPLAALAVAAAGALITVLATLLTWATASVSGPGMNDVMTMKGLDDEINGRITVVLGILALIVVALLALRPVKGLWTVLPILGALVVLISWANTVKVKNTVDEIAEITSGVGGVMKAEVVNGAGVWLSIAGGALLLSTAVLVPVLRRGTRAGAA